MKAARHNLHHARGLHFERMRPGGRVPSRDQPLPQTSVVDQARHRAGDRVRRRVIDEETVKKVLDVLCDEVSDMPKNWNRRFKHNRDKIKTGDIYELSEVVRNLAIPATRVVTMGRPPLMASSNTRGMPSPGSVGSTNRS